MSDETLPPLPTGRRGCYTGITEVLFTADQLRAAQREAIAHHCARAGRAAGVQGEAVALLTVARDDDPTWGGMNFIGLTEYGKTLPAGKYELVTAPSAEEEKRDA